ncbi:MAG: hypothetical protein ACHQHN_05300 [Sphingobacteriales bacterium]
MKMGFDNDDDLETGADTDKDYMTHNGINDDPETDRERQNAGENADANKHDPETAAEKGMLDGPANDLVGQPNGE